MRDINRGVKLNGTIEDLRDAIGLFAEQLGFEVIYDPIPVLPNGDLDFESYNKQKAAELEKEQSHEIENL